MEDIIKDDKYEGIEEDNDDGDGEWNQ
jgi:hypothetical protein